MPSNCGMFSDCGHQREDFFLYRVFFFFNNNFDLLWTQKDLFEYEESPRRMLVKVGVITPLEGPVEGPWTSRLD